MLKVEDEQIYEIYLAIDYYQITRKSDSEKCSGEYVVNIVKKYLWSLFFKVSGLKPVSILKDELCTGIFHGDLSY